MLKPNRRLVALMLSVAAFLVLGYVFVKPKLQDYPPYLSSSADRDGTKAVYTLLEEKGAAVQAWERPWSQLPKGTGQTLVVVQPYEVAEREWSELQSWLKQGNELLLLHGAPTSFPPFVTEELKRDRETESSPQRVDVDRLLSSETGPFMVQVTDLNRPGDKSFTAVIASNYRLKPVEGMNPLLQDDKGILAARFVVGSGGMTLFVVPEWLKNENVLQHAHYELLAPYLPQERSAIWFDEYHHGIQQKPGLLAVYPNWLLAVMVQLTIGLLLWLWLRAVRFGPAYTPRSWTVRRGDETLQAAASWYERRGLALDALAHQERFIRSLLRARWGVRHDATDAQLLHTAKQQLEPRQVEQLAELLRRYNEAQAGSGRYTAKQLLEDSRRADGLIHTLEKE
ncbi:DUF4350 domain-containing protein [Paenibacillus sp. YYML68]|uniref:DUF4350 domain-containing protein n=1 Tax=Paenibacillus sp. YYML68 TaxID=2909250 RepID=UPI0024927BA7|nr:DUF4350 domain-containing protein [Paenibacillus sp. YYML68]